MSTETITSTPTIAAPSRAIASSRVRTFVVVFSISATLVYVACLLFGWPLFTYHPATGRLEWGYALPRRNEGPVMYWYGWIMTTVIVSSVAALLTTFLPERITGRIPLFLLWLLPVLALPIFAFTLKEFFLR